MGVQARANRQLGKQSRTTGERKCSDKKRAAKEAHNLTRVPLLRYPLERLIRRERRARLSAPREIGELETRVRLIATLYP
jgi:hypothetical protein